MKSRYLGRLIQTMAVAGVFATSGCATVFVRSESTAEPEHVFPATVFDARFFWEAGVKGAPPILACGSMRFTPEQEAFFGGIIIAVLVLWLASAIMSFANFCFLLNPGFFPVGSHGP